MFNSILVPLDGSPVSEVALPYAEALARRTHGRLILVRAAHGPALHAEPEHQQFSRVESAQVYLEQMSQALAARGVTELETGVPYGQAAAWIVDEAALRGADLIVMGTHARTGTDRWVHGSVAESVVRHASVPVFLVHAESGAASATQFAQDGRSIVAPLDGSSLAEAALPAAVDLARVVRGRLILLAVVPKPGDPVIGAAGMGVYLGDDQAQRVADSDEYLRRMQVQLRADGLAIETLVARGDAATEIAAAARRYASTAIVMATHGHTGLARAIVGSVAGEVLRASNCPVVMIRPAELPAEDAVGSRR